VSANANQKESLIPDVKQRDFFQKFNSVWTVQLRENKHNNVVLI